MADVTFVGTQVDTQFSIHITNTFDEYIKDLGGK